MVVKLFDFVSLGWFLALRLFFLFDGSDFFLIIDCFGFFDGDFVWHEHFGARLSGGVMRHHDFDFDSHDSYNSVYPV